jgi:hypothetical protein
MNFKEFSEKNAAFPGGVTGKDWKIAKEIIFELEKRTGDFPRAGDAVIFTDSYGEYFPCALIDRVDGDTVSICENGSTYTSTGEGVSASGGAFHTFKIENLKKNGRKDRIFWTFGSRGACRNGGIYFLANVPCWFAEKKRDHDYTTEKYDLRFIVEDKNPDEWGYKWLVRLRGLTADRAFKTDADLDLWKKTYRAVKAYDTWQQNGVYFIYRENRVSLTRQLWDLLNLPLDTRLLNGSIRDCKIEYDENNKMINAYFYEVWDKEHKYKTFLYSDVSDYPFEFRLAREQQGSY